MLRIKCHILEEDMKKLATFLRLKIDMINCRFLLKAISKFQMIQWLFQKVFFLEESRNIHVDVSKC